MNYPFSQIESKWQLEWEKQKAFEVKIDKSRPKYYVLDMFPYPSSSGLHVGHMEGYTASDVISRYKRMQGFNVLHPMGFDAFGLPAEQYAIKTGIHPSVVTEEAIENFKKQLKRFGLSFDWTREISTCDPKYYKWTQLIFKKLFEKGLVYQKEVPVNWCEALKTVLANEEVVGGVSERGGHPVEKRLMKQWMLKITAYSETLLKGLGDLDWLERTKEGQRHWIGKSVGLKTAFEVLGHSQPIEVFTTRPDTLWGVTFLVLAPEHPLAKIYTVPEALPKVEAYLKQTQSKLDVERQTATKKTGVFTGAYALHPLTHEKLPLWISDYVLPEYGTGAVMAVPAHDERDFEMAQTFSLPIKRVINGGDLPFTGEGDCCDSDFINGLKQNEAIQKVIAYFEEKKWGKAHTEYRLKDWNFSRQRFWGEPFPVVHTKDGPKLVADEDLPVLLPDVSDYSPTSTGEPPLSKAGAEWLHTKEGLRETQTMPGSAGSSWYFLRYTDPLNENEPFSFEAQDYFMPVDLYLGGPEHTVGHLLYARFWQRFLFDLGWVSHPEPFKKLIHQGMILGPDGEKMSKSRGNVVNPDDVANEYGADSLRVYEMFMGPLDRDKPWNPNGLVGVFKFLNKIWRTFYDEAGNFLAEDKEPSPELLKSMHKLIQKVTHDIETFAFNTAISQMMIFINELSKSSERPILVLKNFALLLAPFAPHLAEELWSALKQETLVSLARWPTFEAHLAKVTEVTMALQVQGKTKATLTVKADLEADTVEGLAKEVPAMAKILNEKGAPKKVIFVKNKILNFIF